MLGVVLAALSSVSYGGSDFAGAYASKRTDSAVVTVTAQFVSLLTLGVLLVIMPPTAWSATDLMWGGLGGLAIGLALTAFYKALAIGPMSTAAAITALVGTIVPLVAGLALGERPSALTLLGIGAAVPAVVMVSLGAENSHRAASLVSPRERAALSADAAVTRQLAAAAGLGFGLFFVALSRASADSGLMPLVGARAMSILSLSVVLTVGAAWSPVARASIPFIVVTGVLDCAANAFYLTALDNGELTWVAAITSLYPVTTVILARIVLGERLAPLQVVGLVLSGAALALVAIGR